MKIQVTIELEIDPEGYTPQEIMFEVDQNICCSLKQFHARQLSDAVFSDNLLMQAVHKTWLGILDKAKFKIKESK